MRTGIYIRVSTKLQGERFSLKAQEKELVEYTKQQGWKIISILKDIDSGGKYDKKGLNQLLDLVEEGKIDVVLCIDQDRLSRLNTMEWEYLKDVLREHHVKIAEPHSIVDLTNEDQVFISDLKNLIAQREKRTIVKRMMRGKRQKLREGQGWGKPPLGYKFNSFTKKYEVDERWSWVIPFIDDLYLNKEYGMKVIADKLNEISKTPSNLDWNETLVQRRLISKAFHGVMEKKFSNGEVIAIKGIYPPLRTRETWERIQAERIKRKKQFKADIRNHENIHLLRQTHITCGLCNRKINVVNQGNKCKERYYLQHGRKLKLKDHTICDISINTVRVDSNLLVAVQEALQKEVLIKRDILLESDKEETTLLRKSIKTTEKNIHKLKEKIDRLLDLYLEQELSKESMNKKKKSIEKELDSLQCFLESQKAKLETLEDFNLNYDLTYEYLEVINHLNELTNLEKVQLVGNLFPSAILHQDKLILKVEFNNQEVEVLIKDDPYMWHSTKRK